MYLFLNMYVVYIKKIKNPNLHLPVRTYLHVIIF